MSHTLMHPQQHHHHSLLWYLMIGLGITAVLIITVAIWPSITISSPAVQTVKDGQSAYFEYLRGEKIIYSSPLELNKALTEYRAGEKITGLAPLNSGDAMTEYHIGEKPITNFEISELAILAYRQGEKDYK